MTKQNPNFIYAYDNEQQQIIVIDAETGEPIEEEQNHTLAILTHLKAQNDDDKLRKFALWCARKSNEHIKPIQKKFFDLAEKAINNESTPEELEQLYDESEGEAIATDTVGLRQGAVAAPGFLASRECINPNAFEGAKKAARFHCMWAEVNNENDGENLPDYLNEVRPAASQNTIEKTEQAQVDHLLDLIGEE